MDGTPYKIGSREFIVPRLRVATWEKAVLDSKELAKQTDEIGGIDATLAIVVDLLRPNYPDLTVAGLKAELYVDEILEVIGGVIAAGGKRPPKPGEGVSP
jgi:hypothetical protein